MEIRRVLFWAFLASILVLPAWVMFGRALAGAPLGDALLALAFLGPLLALAIGVVMGVTIARKEVRGPRRLAWHDVKTVGPWLLAIVVLGLVVIDTDRTGRTGSALTAWLGDGWLTASQSFTAILIFGIIIGACVLTVVQLRMLTRETRARVEGFVQRMQAPIERADVGEARVERIDGPQAGRVIRLEDEER